MRVRYAALGAAVLAVGVAVVWRRRDAGRVDLAGVVDTYVGETERQLDALLDDAEESDSVLLMEEGDDLLGSRSDGRDDGD